MNYTLDFNALSQIEIPQIILCNRNKKRYGELYPVEKLNFVLNANAIDEISFSVPRLVDGKENPYWDKLVDLKLAYVQKFGYFELYVSRHDDGIMEYKNVTGKSLEVELGQLYLEDFEINSQELEDDTVEDVSPILFYNPVDASKSMLHLALLKAPAWKIGHVDEELWNMQRTFDVSRASIYDFLTGDVADELKCTFQFDSFNREISCFLIENYGNDTNLFISHENLVQDITIEADAGAIKNCFKIVGGEGIYINEVNPNGTDFIWIRSAEDNKDMSPELVEKLNDYDILYQESLEAYQEVMQKIQSLLDQQTELRERLPDDPESTDWSLYGLTDLEEKLKGAQKTEDTYKSDGYGDVSSPFYKTRYLPNHEKILALEAEIKVRTAEIQAVSDEIEELEEQKKEFQGTLNLQEFLGKDLWLELGLYRREELYENTNYSTTELTTDAERFEMELDLFEIAIEEATKASVPKYNFTTTLNNILAIEAFQDQNIEQFQLWNFIRVGINEDEIARIRLVSIQIDFDAIEDIYLEFSDMTMVTGICTDLKDLLEQASGAATSYDTLARQWDSSKNDMTFANQVRKEGLNGALVDIMNADNMEITFNHRGLMCKQWNDEKQDYEPEQLQIINNKIVMTDDTWNSVRAVFGKIQFQENSVYGLIADVLIGHMLISDVLNVSNKDMTFIVDEHGATLRNADFIVENSTNSVRIRPNQDSIFEIYKGSKKVIYLDTAGNANFEGKITASAIDASVINGGNINGTYIKGVEIEASAIKGGTVDGAVVTSSNDAGDAKVRLQNGNIFLNGWNGYLRHGPKDGGDKGYSKLIGVSGKGNLVIGHDGGTGSTYGDNPFENINFYADNINFSLGGGGTPFATLNNKAMIIAGKTLATEAYVIDYVDDKIKEAYQKGKSDGYSEGYSAGLAAGSSSRK